MELTVQSKGPNAQAVQQTITDFFRAEYGDEITITQVPVTEAGAVKGGELANVLAVVAIIIALPGAVLALLDLKERAEKKKRLEVFVQKTRSLIVSPQDHATITINETETLHLRDSSSEQLFDALMSAARKEKENN